MGKIPTYTALTAPNNNDLLVIEDSVSSSTKKITRSNFLKGTALPTDTVTTASITDANVTTAKIADANVTTAKLNNASVTPDKLGTGAATANVATSQTTTSTSFTDLTTVGPAVTVTIGANGLALVSVGSTSSNSGGNFDFTGYAVSGASTVAASDLRSIAYYNTVGITLSGTFLVTGLTPGSNTFTAKYRVSAGTGTFSNRIISVVPL